MKEVIIGKSGDQPFAIKNDCVSRRHARITIDAQGQWTLEDLGSSNGTFVQDENGEFMQVKKVAIGEFTRIALGATTAAGYYFYAHHILEENGSYEAEMRHVIKTYQRLVDEKKELEEKNKTQATIIRILPPLVSALVMIIVFVFVPQYRMYIAVSGVIATSLATMLGMYQAKNTEAMKAIAEKQARLIRCPKCNRQLTPSDVQSEQCPKCGVLM